jgi:ribosomal protein S18 acetylase RimI-like enzyme
MSLNFVRARLSHVVDYVRIGELNTSRFNTVTTDPVEALAEIQNSVTYMIELDGFIIGFVGYITHNPNHAYVSEVQVEPAFRKRGFGGHALDFVLNELSGVELVDLHTHPENPAQNLYERHGFKKTAEIILNYHGTGEPRMRMVLVRK